MVKGYEFEKDRFVIFSPEELKALQESREPHDRHRRLHPRQGGRSDLLRQGLSPRPRQARRQALQPADAQAMRDSGRCALAKWAWKGKQYVVQVRAAEDGLVLQQLLYADEVRSLKELDIEQVTVSAAELQACDAADRPDLRGHLRPDDVRGRGEEAHPRRDRREDRRQADRRRSSRPSRSRAAPGDRPDGSAARQPGQARRRQGQGRRPRPRADAGAGRGGQGAQGRQARAPRSRRGLPPRPRGPGRKK